MAASPVRAVSHIARYRSARRWLAACLLGSLLLSMLVRSNLPDPDWVVGLTFVLLAFGSFVLFLNMMSDVKNAMKPSCASMTTAIEYVGWYGTIHEFVFSSWSYANSFTRRKRTEDDLGHSRFPLVAPPPLLFRRKAAAQLIPKVGAQERPSWFCWDSGCGRPQPLYLQVAVVS